MIKDNSIEQFLDQLASSDATPGGGSAAAVMGAIAAALVSMVANLTVGKKNYEQVQENINSILGESERLRARMLAMIQDDMDVFNRVMQAYAMPGNTDDEKQLRADKIQQALKVATEVPLACAALCAEVIELSGAVANQGNRRVISDAGVAVVCAHAALRSAALNVYINLAGIKDESFVIDRQIRLQEILEKSGNQSEEVYQLVVKQL